jgi:hypothetical protein
MAELNSSYPTGAFKFEEWCDRAFPQWRWSLHTETVDAVKHMREAFEAGYVSAVRHHDATRPKNQCQ